MLFFTEETGSRSISELRRENFQEMSKMNKHYADICASIQK